MDGVDSVVVDRVQGRAGDVVDSVVGDVVDATGPAVDVVDSVVDYIVDAVDAVDAAEGVVDDGVDVPPDSGPGGRPQQQQRHEPGEHAAETVARLPPISCLYHPGQVGLWEVECGV